MQFTLIFATRKKVISLKKDIGCFTMLSWFRASRRLQSGGLAVKQQRRILGV